MAPVRRALPEDAEAIAATLHESREVAYRGLLPDDVVDWMRAQLAAEWWRSKLAEAQSPASRIAVAERDGDVVGFAHCGASDGGQSDAENGELFALFVRPADWGTGVGPELLAWAEAALHTDGCRQARLWVLEVNTRAQAAVRRAGWRPDGGRRLRPLGPRELLQLRFRKPLGKESKAESDSAGVYFLGVDDFEWRRS